jgi:c-di-GMP-binding flagellar brake protein YcgR
MRKKVIPPKKVNVKIKEGMKVFLDIELKDGGGGTRHTISLKTVVDEVLDDGSLIVYMPTHKSYYYPLPAEDSFLLHFFVKSVMYAVPVRYEERFKTGNIVYAKLSRLGEIVQRQRRHCYRLPCSMPVTIERLYSNDDEQQQGEGRMINFSDGGMLFATNEDINVNDKIILTFDIGKVETVEATALRVENPTIDGYKRNVAVQFIILEKSQKSRFFKFIMDEQREERKRQLEAR